MKKACRGIPNTSILSPNPCVPHWRATVKECGSPSGPTPQKSPNLGNIEALLRVWINQGDDTREEAIVVDHCGNGRDGNQRRRQCRHVVYRPTDQRAGSTAQYLDRDRHGHHYPQRRQDERDSQSHAQRARRDGHRWAPSFRRHGRQRPGRFRVPDADVCGEFDLVIDRRDPTFDAGAGDSA